MVEELNSLLLNEVVHTVLFLILIVIYVNTLIDRRIQPNRTDSNFSLFVLFSAIYVGLMLLWWPVQNSAVRMVLSSVRVLSAMTAYSFSGLWLISIIEEKQTVPKHIKFVIRHGAYILFIISCLLLLIIGNTAVANIPILLYYLLLEALILYYCKALGKAYTLIITLFIVPLLLLQAQEWWNYTPANIYLVLAVLILYSRMWVTEKRKYLETRELLQEEENKLTQYKTEILLSQIGPHFIYNTLSTIAALCTEDPKGAQKLTIDFSGYLRNNLTLGKMQQLSSFQDELNHTKKYLEIEQVRFGKRLNVEYHIQEANFYLPSLSLQPIVENAVKHGVTKKQSGGTISISTERRGEYYAVIISDNGVGCTPADLAPREGHYGLSISRERLKILVNGDLLVESCLNLGTTVTMLVKTLEGTSSDENCHC